MLKSFTVLFPRESDHSGFLSWLRAFQAENRFESNAKIGFIRDPLTPTFSRWTVAPESQFDAVFNAALAFNGKQV